MLHLYTKVFSFSTFQTVMALKNMLNTTYLDVQSLGDSEPKRKIRDICKGLSIQNASLQNNLLKIYFKYSLVYSLIKGIR